MAAFFEVVEETLLSSKLASQPMQSLCVVAHSEGRYSHTLRSTNHRDGIFYGALLAIPVTRARI